MIEGTPETVAAALHSPRGDTSHLSSPPATERRGIPAAVLQPRRLPLFQSAETATCFRLSKTSFCGAKLTRVSQSGGTTVSTPLPAIAVILPRSRYRSGRSRYGAHGSRGRSHTFLGGDHPGACLIGGVEFLVFDTGQQRVDLRNTAQKSRIVPVSARDYSRMEYLRPESAGNYLEPQLRGRIRLH